MTEEILVSVIIPTYKRSDMLPRAIDSVLNQTYKNVEAVIVDDNNPDTEWRLKTEELMQQYSGDDRVQYVRHIVNKNGAAARNTGIRSARGTVVSFLDDDDLMLPERISKCVEVLMQNVEYDAAFTDVLEQAKTFEKVTFVGEVANFVDQIKESLPEATILPSLPSALLIGRLGLSLPPVNVDAFVPHYLKRVEAEENWLKTHEETNRDNYIKRV